MDFFWHKFHIQLFVLHDSSCVYRWIGRGSYLEVYLTHGRALKSAAQSIWLCDTVVFFTTILHVLASKTSRKTSTKLQPNFNQNFHTPAPKLLSNFNQTSACKGKKETKLPLNFRPIERKFSGSFNQTSTKLPLLRTTRNLPKSKDFN